MTKVIVAFRNFANASKNGQREDRISLPTKMSENHICVEPNEMVRMNKGVVTQFGASFDWMVSEKSRIVLNTVDILAEFHTTL
jgi:hypothetical protein